MYVCVGYEIGEGEMPDLLMLSLSFQLLMATVPFKFRPQVGFEPGSLSEHLLEFDACSKPLGHQGRFLRHG